MIGRPVLARARARLDEMVRPGVRYMVAGAFFFSVMGALVKWAGRRLPSQEIVLARAVVTLVLSWAMVRRAGVTPWGSDRRLLVVRGVLGFIALSCFYYAVVHLPLADATVIQYTNPVFTAAIAAWLLGERVRLVAVGCMGASLVGVVLIARPSFLFGGGGALDPAAVAIALAGAIFSAAAYVTVRRLRATEDALVVVFYFALVSTIGAVPTTAPVAVWPGPLEWLLLLGVGITTQIAQVYMTRGLHLEPAGRATAIGYLQIVFAGVWGALFFDEIPDGTGIAGAALIVASTFLLGRRAGDARAPGAELRG
ncbi:MAG: DMT family transporter [Gemmatimonadota bacterium]